MDDTQRLDAIGKYGLCIVQHQQRINGQWSPTWECHYGIDKSVSAQTIREAIDMAVQASQESESATEKGL